MLEAELFGYVDGSFTGARKGGKPGKFELANKGTIFLDEIGDMPLTMQSKLLRVLQERELEPIGSGDPIPIDVRIISATNKNLPSMDELNGKLGRNILKITPAAIQLFLSYHWPGNVRELVNVLEGAMNFCRSSIIEPEDLPFFLHSHNEKKIEREAESLQTKLDCAEKMQIVSVLKQCKGNRKEAVAVLELSKITLYRLMKKHNLL